MSYVRKTYIEFLYPGSFFKEIRKFKTRDVSKVKMPKNASCFHFFDILSLVVYADGNKVELTSERINVSPIYYYGGTVYTLAELKREFPNDSTLINAIKDNGHKKAIRCRNGSWMPFKETDIFIETA